jgi:hypothetical protein
LAFVQSAPFFDVVETVFWRKINAAVMRPGCRKTSGIQVSAS